MAMPNEDFLNLLNDYKENEDILITKARGSWEKAPTQKALIQNVGLHILLKKDALMSLFISLENSSSEDKIHILEEFCADIDMPNTGLIEDILKDTKFTNTEKKPALRKEYIINNNNEALVRVFRDNYYKGLDQINEFVEVAKKISHL